MKKTIFLCIAILILSISAVSAELSPCSSGSLTTAVNKEFQMEYANEDFLQLKNIDLLKDVSELKDLTCLQYMDATDRTIKGDISNLKSLVNLEVFSLYSNPEVSGDICSLAGATNLRSLKFAFDPKITGDISCLKDLTKLETFAMTHTQISGDLSVFANMPNLKAIYISGTNIKGDICALSKLTNLQELGIADEYPGNPDITGDLSCLSNLKKITKASIYNTKTTNCEQFTKNHPNIEQGGCSKESMKTLVDYGQKYEKKIGKETQTEVRGQPDYQQNAIIGNNPPDNRDQQNTGFESSPPDNRNLLAKFISWIRNLLGKAPDRSNGPTEKSRQPEDVNQIRTRIGPGGCRTQAECDAFCNKPENRESCSKFAPPGSETIPKLACRLSILPSSKGTAPYTARVCVDNPNERIQQEYTDYIDFEGDGSWDEYEDLKHGCHSHNYPNPGTFSPTAKIVNSNGIESDVCQTTITVN